MAVTTIQMSVARERKNHAYQIRRESKEYEELQIGETTASVKELLEVSKKNMAYPCLYFDSDDDLCDS